VADLSRREFLKWGERGLAAVGLVAIASPVVAYFYPADLSETPAEPVSAGPVDELAVGEAKFVPFGRYPAVVVNTSEGLRAYSAVCTHFACIVNWDPALGEFVCPCHNASFDPVDGHVLGGPPPRGLDALTVTVVDDQIMVGAPV
jgi:cytochrome b6-f complex iron-sulfur subunit